VLVGTVCLLQGMASSWDLLCVMDPLVRGLFIHIDVVFIYVYYVYLLLEEGWMSVSAFVSSRAPLPLVVSVVSRIWLSLGCDGAW
jgi:hypothetical protein